MKKIVLFTMILLAIVPIAAQNAPLEGGDTPRSRVYVTTQDRSSLRAGPGTLFERLTVVPPTTTIPAIGRTVDSGWIQVEYEGMQGWIVDWLLVWSGDLISLPVDGVNPESYARRIGVPGITTRETPIYHYQVTPENQVGSLPAGTPVELTGRLGSSGFFQMQILYQDQLYWVGSWNIRLRGRSYLDLLDTSYLYPYGRLVTRLDTDINESSQRLSRIESLWRDLDAGYSVSCNNIPELIDRRRTADADVRSEPIFAPLVTALDEAIRRTNTAIAMFEDVCGRVGDDAYVTPKEVTDALDAVDAARRNFVLARSLLVSLAVRDPFINSGNQ